MKILTVITHSEAKQQFLDEVHKLSEISGFTFSHAEGHGTHLEVDGFLAARDQVVGYSARIRVDLLLEDSDCGHVIKALKDSDGLLEGHSVYWVSSVEESGHF